MALNWNSRMVRVCSWATLGEAEWIPHSVWHSVSKMSYRAENLLWYLCSHRYAYPTNLPFHTQYRCMSIFTLDTQFYFKYALLENIICWLDIKIIYLHFMVIRVYSVCVYECIAHPWHSWGGQMLTPGVSFFVSSCDPEIIFKLSCMKVSIFNCWGILSWLYFFYFYQNH